LRTIDTLWVEHLTEIDDMRRGIGLRGYAGEEPLNAFKKVAFQLYEELRGFIRRQVASTIFRVSVTHHPDATPMPGPGQPARNGDGANAPAAPAVRGGGGTVTSAGAMPGSAAMATPSVVTAAGGGAARLPGLDAGRPRVIQEQLGDQIRDRAAVPAGRTGPKLGRNDPCYCGSGLKYKKCHGR
jgi:preprotein translocase subunit SecA